MQPDKWLGPVPAGEALIATAERALEGRFCAVVYYLRLVTAFDDDTSREEDREQIHRTRVWSRRSTATLRVFSPVFEAGTGKEWRLVLKRTRRATGRVRDLDVLIDRLLMPSADPHEGLSRWLRSQRIKAREELRQAWRSNNPEPILTRLLGDLPAHLKSTAPAEPFSLWARTRLRTIYDRFRQSWPRLDDGAEAHHRFRVRGKYLRYALELLAAPFAEDLLAAVYAEIEKV